MQGGPVDELLDVAVERPVLEQLEVEVGRTPEDRVRAGPAGDHREDRHLDAVDVVARLKEESEVPLRSHGSLSMNRALMAAGLVDRVQVTIFPVITGQNGSDAIFEGAADFDLELLESRTLDGNIQELTYLPTLHV